VVLPRPHFVLADDQLFFLDSRRPFARLSKLEAAIWTALEARPTIRDLRTRYPSEADSVLRRFAELRLCEIARTDYPRHRRRILVLEPHSDDAVLSVGGTMWLRRHECQFILVTIAGRSNFTSYFELDRDYFDVGQVSAMRRAEGELLASLLGGEYHALDQLDATLRYRHGDWSLDWYRRHKRCVSAFVEHHSGPAELRRWIAAVRGAVLEAAAEEIWFPLGGLHTDHQLTRDAVLTLLRDEPALFEGREIRIYRDVPYAGQSPEFVVNALSRAGAVLTPETVPITSVFSEKLHLISLYASQFKLDAIRQGVEKSAQMAADDGGLAERLWKMPVRPTDIAVDSLRYDEPSVRRATAALLPWVARHRDAKRIRLLLVAPAGRWKEDMSHLLQVFPSAHLDVFVASEAEAKAFESPRIRVTRVGMSRARWALLAMRLAVGYPVPTILLTDRHRWRIGRCVAAFWFLCDAIVVPRMSDVVSALRQIATPQ
jgi:LmbE family N-acetylglucosaminyl deacetylase